MLNRTSIITVLAATALALAPAAQGGPIYVESFGNRGSGDGKFDEPESVAVDSAGGVYVADTLNHRIQKLSESAGSLSHEWSFGSLGSGDGQFWNPYGVAVDSAGNVYVADTSNHRIQKFSQSGGSLSHEWSLGSFGSGEGEFSRPRGVAVDAAGNVYVADTHNYRIQWWFDPEAIPPGGTTSATVLTVHSEPRLGDVLTLSAGRTLQISDVLTIEPHARLNLADGNVSGGVVQIQRNGAISVEGSISSRISSHATSEIHATGGAALGDVGRYDGFVYQGLMFVGANHVTLLSKGFANLGLVTEIDGGTLAAPNGIVIGAGRSLAGWGAVEARVSAAFGSTLEATGGLTLGDAAAYDGFYSDGSLLTGANTVTINDRNEAVLGSLTELGDGASGGTLTAGNADPGDTHAHFLLEQGKNMVGRGAVNGHYKNHGHVIGDGTAVAERVVFNSPWVVSGKGTFANTLIMGTFAPGESPGITNGENQGFGGKVEIELGGTEPGFGDDNHDQINDTGTVLLSGSPTLEILPWNSFVPDLGDEFMVLT
ncbi:hypothetical protein LCGC14_2217220, partial [marine sediment metagenome]